MFCERCAKEIPEGAASCSDCGAPAFGADAPPQPAAPKSGGKKIRGWIIGCILIIVVLWVLIGVLPDYIMVNYPGPRRQYTAALEQLSHVKTGLESYLADHDDLTGADTQGDAICHLVLAGFTRAADCKGQVAARVNTVVRNFKIRILPNSAGALTNYEISGNALDKTKCGIMITEAKALPEKYDNCTEAIPAPVH